MDYRLSDLSACFEGVIPSIIATAAADGTPNISYLSHVVRVDDDHVALSNQFFAKTAANIRANRHVTVILVDCLTGDQFLLDASFEHSVDAGPLFDRIALQLKATSAQVGMSDVMRLKSADVFRVHGIEIVPSPVARPTGVMRRAPVDLPAIAEACRRIEQEDETEGIIDGLLASLGTVLGYFHALVLIADRHRASLITTGSIGYDDSGFGSEVAASEGLIGAAAKSGRTIKVNDMSRVQRLGEAIAPGSAEDDGNTIAFPQLSSAMSQIAVPIAIRSEILGILFVESQDRMAFRDEDQAALEILASRTAHALQASDHFAAAAEPPPVAPSNCITLEGPGVTVAHHIYDDSIFVDDIYIVKGIAGALLRQMIEWHLESGRREFSNRELRLALAARMPDIKDNLETRLLLLRRRLDEKRAGLRIVRSGRGRLRIEATGQLLLKPMR